MNKLYNTQKDITSSLINFIKNIVPNIRKTQLNILPYIVFGMIISESVVTSDIASKLKDDFSLVKFDSVKRRIRRFFNNKLFDIFSFYNYIIKYVISNYKIKHPDKNVHIVFDHMFMRDHFTILMFSLRIGKQGIPLWFRIFKGNDDSNAFANSLVNEGISYIFDLFKDKDVNLIFLADRFFVSPEIMNHIDSLGGTFVFRVKTNIKIKVFSSQDNIYVWKYIGDINPKVHSSKIIKDVLYTFEHEMKANLVIAPSKNTDDPWYLITNGDVNNAIKHYNYRFGAIEMMFKSQKSNGFNLEDSACENLHAFNTMYGLCCFSVLWLTILGADYTKNSRCYKHEKIETVKRYSNGSRKRIVSLFRTGLILINRAFNNAKYIRIPYNFILYDV